MASLKCHNCGFGMHHHDEFDGIGYILISLSDWERLIKTDISFSAYELDDNSKCSEVWCCPECGTLHVFRNSVEFVGAYKPYEVLNKSACKESDKYILLSDEEWYKYTESGLCGLDLANSFPNYPFTYAAIDSEGLYIFEDTQFSAPVKGYKAIKTSSL